MPFLGAVVTRDGRVVEDNVVVVARVVTHA
jgi:hypothetical protein